MKRWLSLLLLLGAPHSSPLGCGGDGCLRNSDCPREQTCRGGRCELAELGEGEGGAGEEPAATGGRISGGAPSRAGASAVAGSGGAATAGRGGSAGSESNAGEPSASGGEPSASGGVAGGAQAGSSTTTEAGATFDRGGEPNL